MSVYSDNDDNDIQMLTNVVKAEQDQNRPLSPPSERVTIDLTESDTDASAHPNCDVDPDAGDICIYCYAKIFFADMSSSQRAESVNKLLKNLLDSKTILTEFLAGFERALERREDAEDIAAVREILYPTHAITH